MASFLVGSLDAFSQDCLDAHNNYRAKHGVPPLMWSHDLAEGAQSWADQLASTDSLQHDQVAIQNHKIGRKATVRQNKSNNTMLRREKLLTKRNLSKILRLI